MRDLTELECVVLGVAAKFGPLSPYAVRQHFAGSLTSRFSSSTGSIYPVLKRLEEAGLISSRASPRGRQARSRVSATAAGRRALRRWLAGAPEPGELAAPSDPLRTRLYFVGLLSPKEQQRFFEQALDGLRQELAASEAYVETYGTEGPEAISRLAARGAVFAARARIRWLKEARAEMLGS